MNNAFPYKKLPIYQYIFPFFIQSNCLFERIKRCWLHLFVHTFKSNCVIETCCWIKPKNCTFRYETAEYIVQQHHRVVLAHRYFQNRSHLGYEDELFLEFAIRISLCYSGKNIMCFVIYPCDCYLWILLKIRKG